MGIEISARKNFTGFALDARLEIRTGEFFCIAGPSGAGKTTLLDIIAGLLDCGGCAISADGTDIGSLPPEKRGVGYVFQGKFLFPHLNVRENVAFGVECRKQPVEYADEALRMFGLSGLAGRSIHSLSGGEMQRVAFARAIAYKPRLLLLDEPLKELDALAKTQILAELTALHEKTRFTAIYVTHDLEEAFAIADRIAVFNNGRVEQVGTPSEIFRKPKTAFVKEFTAPYRIARLGGADNLVQVRRRRK